MFGWRLRLIDDAQHAWKWSSMRFLALGGVTQMALVSTPDAVKEHVPEPVLQALAVFSLACIVLAGVGRVTRVTPSNGDSHV